MLLPGPFHQGISGQHTWLQLLCVRTLDGLWEWPNVIFVEFLARHMVRPVSSLGASSQFPPPVGVPQGSILGSGFWYVRTVAVFWGWPKLHF